MQQRAVLAIDIGGTKLAVGIVDEGGRVLEYRRAPNPNPPTGDGEAVLQSLFALIDELGVQRSDYIGIGVGCGGPMVWPTGVVSPLNIPTWRDFPLRDRLAEAFGTPVRIHNDAICVAIAEHWRGAGAGVDNVLGMVVSTGVGGGLILGGRLVNGSSGNAGHIGHAIVHEFEPLCRCGAIGCLEAIASGPNISAWAHGEGWREAYPREQRTGQDLVEDARRGDRVALAAMRRAGRALGIGIATATVLCDLQVVAIGGGLSQAGPLLFDPLEISLRERIGLDYAAPVRVVPAGLGQESGLVGAAALVLHPERYWSAD